MTTEPDKLPTASDADAHGEVLASSPHVAQPFRIRWDMVRVSAHEITEWQRIHDSSLTVPDDFHGNAKTYERFLKWHKQRASKDDTQGHLPERRTP